MKRKTYRVTFDNHREATLDDYHLDFAQIWSRDVKERSVFDLWLHVVDHAYRVANAVRRQRPPEVIDDIADTTVWLMSFIAHCTKGKSELDRIFEMELLPSTLVWRKYPATCPICLDFWFLSLLELEPGEPPARKLRERGSKIVRTIEDRAESFAVESCTCLTRVVTHQKEKDVISSLRRELDSLRLEYAMRLERASRNITKVSELEDMFHRIYANTYHVLSLEVLAFHLLEEVGEATQALKDCYTYDDGREPYSEALHATRKARLQDEIADTFMWLFGLALKIKTTYEGHAREYTDSIDRPTQEQKSARASLAFSEILWAKYGRTRSGAHWSHLKCPGCGEAPCECPRDLKILWSSPNGPTAAPTDKHSKDPEDSRDLVFIGYARQDVEWRDELKKTLSPLVRNQTLSTWDDSRIQAGDSWRAELRSALGRSGVAVLLVSPDFLASEHISKHVLPAVLEASRSAEQRVLWIPIKHSLYQETPLAELEPLQDPAKPLNSLSEADKCAAMVRICERIKKNIA